MMPPREEPCYSPGRLVLDKYELLQPLAEGGMGVVWIARHRALEVDVAVKLTLGDASDEFRARQRRALSEARLAAQLVHPAICRVLDFGLTAEGDPCVVTELLRGETLDRVLLLEGRLAPVTAVQIILPVLDALAVAHEHGIVHQDVKPSNIFLARDAQRRLQPKLLDFGIARAQREPASWEQAGTISGTPCYMSPEQASGSGDVDQRSDLWSVCATLYELLSGVPPFDGQTCASLLARVIQAEPRPLAEDELEDRELSAIVLRGLQKPREQRWGTAHELSLALARWLLVRGIEVDASGQALRARLPASEPRTSAIAGTGTLVSEPAPAKRWWPSPRQVVSSAVARRLPRMATLGLGALLALTTSVSLLKARSRPVGAAASDEVRLTEARTRNLARLEPAPAPLAVAATRDGSSSAIPSASLDPDAARASPGPGSPANHETSRSSAAAPKYPVSEPSAENLARTPARVESAPARVAAPRALPGRGDNELGYDFGF